MCQLLSERHAGNITALQQNRAVLNWGCQPTGVDLYNGHKIIVIVRIETKN